jgi:hypothetical protein
MVINKIKQIIGVKNIIPAPIKILSPGLFCNSFNNSLVFFGKRLMITRPITKAAKIEKISNQALIVLNSVLAFCGTL